MGICGYPIPFLMARGNHWRYRTVSSIPNSWQGCPAAFLAECTLLWGFGRRGVIMNLQKLRGSVRTRFMRPPRCTLNPGLDAINRVPTEGILLQRMITAHAQSVMVVLSSQARAR